MIGKIQNRLFVTGSVILQSQRIFFVQCIGNGDFFVARESQIAVRIFQQGNRLLVDGNVGLQTWNAIADQYNALSSKTNIE